MYTIKNKNLFFALLIMLFIQAIACNPNKRTRTVKVSNGDDFLKIEYRGEAAFSYNGKAVDTISPEGYIKYKTNNQQVYIESDENGVLTYKVYSNGHRLSKNDVEASEILRSAVKKIEEHYYW